MALAAHEGHEQVVRVLKGFQDTGALPMYRLEPLESLVNDVVLACESGDVEASLRVVDHFYIRRPMGWDRVGADFRIARLRRFVWSRLGVPERGMPELSDSRLLITKSYGFESWEQLVGSCET
jgi:hypothetical protein